MAVLFTSDLHLGHELVAVKRGFSSSESHDAAIAEYWDELVKPDDHLWILGDICLARWRYALDFIKERPGVKHLIAGNHDPVHSMHRKSWKMQKPFHEVFESVSTFARRTIEGQEVLLHHFPYNTDHTEEVRYTQYRLKDQGRWLLHGHTHGPERLHGHEIHVGLDAWNLQFVTLETIQQLIRENPVPPRRASEHRAQQESRDSKSDQSDANIAGQGQ